MEPKELPDLDQYQTPELHELIIHLFDYLQKHDTHEDCRAFKVAKLLDEDQQAYAYELGNWCE